MTRPRQPLQTPRTRIGRLRRQADMSLGELSTATGISKGILSIWERGSPLSPEQEARVIAVLEGAIRSKQ